MSLEDREYVQGVLAGKPELFEPLVRKYNRMAGAIAYGIVGDFQQAEDIVQEAFLKAYRSLGSLRDPARFRAWLAEIARSKALDWVRSRREQPMADLADTFSSGGRFHDAPSVEEEHMQAESRQKVLEAVMELPGADRTVLVLKHMEGLSYKEIAEVTGASVGSVESRLFRARQTLRKKLSSTKT